MSVGWWWAEARTALHATAAAMTGNRPDTAAHAYATFAARTAVYQQLTRTIEVLIGGQPLADTPTRRAGANLVMNRCGQNLTRLYVGLYTAAAPQPYPATPARPQVADQALRRAADCLGAAGDILVTHVPPQRRPRSREGQAIRAGAGVAAAVGQIAELTLNLLEVDSALPAWLARESGPIAATCRPAVDAATWATAGQLASAAHDLQAETRNDPDLVTELGISRLPIEPAPPIVTCDDAATALAAASNWIWRHRAEVTITHLKAATRTGYAISQLGTDVDRQSVAGWRAAAAAAARLSGTPAADSTAVAELNEVQRWALTRLDIHERPPGEQVALAGLAKHLPPLAAGLYRGLHHAVHRHDIFTGHKILEKPPGAPIYLATQTWHPATTDDSQVRDLRGDLWSLHPRTQPPTPPRGSRTASAFPTLRPAPAQPEAASANRPPALPARAAQIPRTR